MGKEERLEKYKWSDIAASPSSSTELVAETVYEFEINGNQRIR